MKILVPEIIDGDSLSVADNKRLSELEGVIEENFTGFVAVGLALAEIRDKGLYREKCQTFEEYCQLSWDVNRVRAYQLIDAARVVENVKNFLQSAGSGDNCPVPFNDAQARELSKLPENEQIEVWQRLINLSRNSGTKITAKAVKKAVQSYKGDLIDQFVEKTKKETKENNTDFQSAEFTEAFEKFFDQVRIEKDANWRYTSRKTVFYHLQGLIDVVSLAVPGTLDGYGCAMELSDREKLKKAGFKMFRMDAKTRVIEEWHHGDTWTMYVECPTPKVLLDTFTQLLENHMHLKG